MIDETVKKATGRMEKSVDSLKTALAKIRTGRAHPSLLEHIRVSYYGNEVPLTQIANIAAEDARTLTVTPWERNMVGAVEKAIMTSDLGLVPNSAGTVIRVPMPPLTEARRKDFVKVIRNEAEEGRVAIRNIRRDANSELKEALKNKAISEDDLRRGEETIQKLTDKFIKEVDALVERKEADLLTI